MSDDMEMWLQLGLGGGALGILYAVLILGMNNMREQNIKIISAMIQKENKKNSEVDRLIAKIDEMVKSIHELSINIVKNNVKEDALKEHNNASLIRIENSIQNLNIKFEKSISKVHDRIDTVSVDIEAIKTTTANCIRE